MMMMMMMIGPTKTFIFGLFICVLIVFTTAYVFFPQRSQCISSSNTMEFFYSDLILLELCTVCIIFSRGVFVSYPKSCMYALRFCVPIKCAQAYRTLLSSFLFIFFRSMCISNPSLSKVLCKNNRSKGHIVAVSKLRAPRFDPQVTVCVGFIWVLWYPPAFKNTCRVYRVLCSIQSVFLPNDQCSHDKLQIHQLSKLSQTISGKFFFFQCWECQICAGNTKHTPCQCCDQT